MKKKSYVNRSNKIYKKNFFRILSNTPYNNVYNNTITNSNQDYYKSTSNYINRRLALLSPPIKTFSVSAPYTSIDNSWNPKGLVYPARGSTSTTRLGSDIMLKSVEIRYTWQFGTDDFNCVRTTLVQFTGQNADGAYPSVPATDAGAAAMVFSPYGINHPNNSCFNTQTKQEYRVLYDKTHSVSTVGPRAVNGHVLITKFPVQKLHFLSDVSDINVPGLSEGLVVMMVTSDSTIGGHPSFQYVAKLNYTDT